MTVIKMSSDEARSKWREVIDTAVAGNHVVIERYGKPVVTIVAHSDYKESFGQAEVVREPSAVYQAQPWDRQTLKAELLAELKAELLAEPKWRDAILHVEQNSENVIQKVEATGTSRMGSPRLVHPEQAADFQKEIVSE